MRRTASLAEARARRPPGLSLLLAVELAGPVQVVPPRVRHRPQADLDGHGRDPRRARRLRAQGHARLLRRAGALAQVAVLAGGDDVAPLGLAAERARHDVVVGELADRLLLAAVLAGVAVARVDVDARELHRLLAAAERAQQ